MTDSRAMRAAVPPDRTVIGSARDVIASLGAGRRGIRRSRAASSARFDGRRFRNSEPGSPVSLRVFGVALRGFMARGRVGRPQHPIPLRRPEFPAAAADLAVTWLGHASVLIEIDGHRVLADPMFGHRASPADFAGPSRLHPAPIDLKDLPPLDAVLISHDHYDHLDRPTVRELVTASQAPFLVPVGVGAHLRFWGVPASRVVELDWDESTDVGPLHVTCTPARHFSGRTLRRNGTLWSSWAIAGPTRRVFFGGDTGYTATFAEIGHRHGPFDLTMLPIGAYADAWPDIHMTPEQALLAHQDLGGAVLLPIHWATFDLAPHPWVEPVQRLLRAARGETIVIPRPGGRFEADHPPAVEEWWR